MDKLWSLFVVFVSTQLKAKLKVSQLDFRKAW